MTKPNLLFFFCATHDIVVGIDLSSWYSTPLDQYFVYPSSSHLGDSSSNGHHLQQANEVSAGPGHLWTYPSSTKVGWEHTTRGSKAWGQQGEEQVSGFLAALGVVALQEDAGGTTSVSAGEELGRCVGGWGIKKKRCHGSLQPYGSPLDKGSCV